VAIVPRCHSTDSVSMTSPQRARPVRSLPQPLSRRVSPRLSKTLCLNPPQKTLVSVRICFSAKSFCSQSSISSGQDVQPTRDLSRFVRWSEYVRLQRQKVILQRRLKVPPAIAQFSHTLDKNTATQLFKLLDKCVPSPAVLHTRRRLFSVPGTDPRPSRRRKLVSLLPLKKPPPTKQKYVLD
jgi:hypothetical protein